MMKWLYFKMCSRRETMDQKLVIIIFNLSLVLKRSTLGLLMLSLNFVGFVIFYLRLRYLIIKETYINLVYFGNASAIYLSSNTDQHQRSKHIEINIYFVFVKVQQGHQVCALHVPFHYHIADVFTKGLPTVLSYDFRDSFNICQPPASTWGCVRL